MTTEKHVCFAAGGDIERFLVADRCREECDIEKPAVEAAVISTLCHTFCLITLACEFRAGWNQIEGLPASASRMWHFVTLRELQSHVTLGRITIGILHGQSYREFSAVDDSL